MVRWSDRRAGVALLVTHLDGYTQDDAQALATRALAAEQGLGQGEVLLDLEPDFGIGDKTMEPAPIPGITQEDGYGDWNADMEHASDDLAAEIDDDLVASITVSLNMQSVFMGDQVSLLGYFSWGSNDDNFSQAA